MLSKIFSTRAGEARPLRGLIGCVTGLLILACGAVVVGVLLHSIRSSDVFEMAVMRAQSHPDAIRALGEPIRVGFFINGALSTSGTSGRAKFLIPVSGPRDRGTLTVVAAKSGGDWQFTTLELAPKAYPDTIDLLAER